MAAASSHTPPVAQEARRDYVQFVCQSGFVSKFQMLIELGQFSFGTDTGGLS